MRLKIGNYEFNYGDDSDNVKLLHYGGEAYIGLKGNDYISTAVLATTYYDRKLVSIPSVIVGGERDDTYLIRSKLSK